MPPRSAIVAFSVEDVYAIAELIRRQKGGAAVVMGALSPRTRNAQVALYQNGDVDYLVATDAIGMGLNLDITHVAFSGLVKFDGRRHRHLAASELAQIAGRAGRYTTDGTFGVTGEAPPLEPEVVEAIENHRFRPLSRLQWRNSALDFATPEALIASLEAPADRPDLQRAREADDLATLKELAATPRGARATARRRRHPPPLGRLPDPRLPQGHASPSTRASACASSASSRAGGGIPTDWLARQIARIDRTDGDIDALSKRLAYIRTWTYVAQRRDWVDDADHWRDETRAVEDRLSDALHVQLTQRFVDRRTSVLMRRLKQRESLLATVTENGEVHVEDQFVGRLEGFRFLLDPTADADQARTLRAAGIAALAPALSLRADRFYNAPDTEIDVTEQGGLMWGEHAVGKLAAGADALSPQVQPFVDEDAAPEIAEKVRRRLSHWIDRRIAPSSSRCSRSRRDETLTGMARGIAFRLVEALGVIPRGEVADEVKGLDQESRASLRKHGVRFGQYTVFLPLLLKPAPTRLRLVLWSLAESLPVFPEAPPPGLVTVAGVPDAPAGLLSARRLPARRRAGHPHRHAGAAGRHDPQPRRPHRLRGGPGDALDHRPVARAVREAHAGHGLHRDRRHPPQAEAPGGAPAGGGRRRRARDRPAARTPEPDAPAPDVPVPDQPDAPVPQPGRCRRNRDAAGRAGARSRSRPARPARSRPAGASARAGPARGPFLRAAGPSAPRPHGGRRDRPTRRRRTSRRRRRSSMSSPAPRAAVPSGRPAPSAGAQAARGGARQAEAAARRGEAPGQAARRARATQAGPKREDRPAAQPRPPRPEKPIDPDNPFAALMALKLRS